MPETTSDDDDECCVWVACSVLAVIATSVILGLVLGPYRLHTRVDSAVLAAFDTSTPPPKSTHALRYNLSVDLTFRNNLHRNISFQVLDVTASAFYGDFMLGFPAAGSSSFPTPFSQGPKNTTVLKAAFAGTVAAYPSVTAEVERERADGTVHLKVRVSLKLRITAWGIRRPVHRYSYDCWLWFPPPRDAPPAVFDAGTRCRPV